MIREVAERPWAKALTSLAAMIVVGLIFPGNGAFYRAATHRDLLRDLSVQGVLAAGMTLVILSGGIDLAVASVLALGAVVFAKLTISAGMSAFSAIALVLAFGAAMGAAMGGVIARLSLQPFIVTLAGMAIARGLAKRVAGGQKVTPFAEGSAGIPPIFERIDATILGGAIPIPAIVFAFALAIVAVILRFTTLGRYIYAIGGSREAARLSGVPVQRTLVVVYAISGLFAALAGICQAAQETHGDPETAAGFELDAIAMVVIGGTSLAGGRGGAALTLIGALTIGYLRKILSINAYSTETRLMLTGAIIVGAALLQRGHQGQGIS